MNKITFRDLQRLTVKQLKEASPCSVTVNGKESFILTDDSDSQEPTVKSQVTVKQQPATSSPIQKDVISLTHPRGEMSGDDYI